jgi:hypothetical protein
LNPFKIQARFKLDFVLEFIIQNTERFGSPSKKEMCSILSILHPYQISKFLYMKKVVFCIFKLGVLEVFGKVYDYLENLYKGNKAQPVSTVQPGPLGETPRPCA